MSVVPLWIPADVFYARTASRTLSSDGSRVYESELRGRKRTARKHLQIVHQHMRPGRLLDIGCASGLFLVQAMQAGWNVSGIEPNEALCEDSRKKLSEAGDIQCT
jgi:2-polyprenyl-3-methyl-5-hydroxy-6-metoxy-1,4-benzoquinol methylase